jgi:16S rRNA (uracil1498-N3)-methyltransferase
VTERRRFVIEPAECGETVSFDKDESAHIRRSLRLGAGGRVEGTDGRGWIYELKLLDGPGRDPQATVLKKERFHRTRPLDVIVAVGMIKGARMDWAVEKAAELGARSFVPLRCERTEVSGHGRVPRWRRVARAALKQSLAAHRMHVCEPRDLEYALKLCRAVGMALVGEPEAPPLRFGPAELTGRRSCLVAIGPEGSFTPAEIHGLRAAGAVPFTLGPARLRTETAVAASLAALWQAVP